MTAIAVTLLILGLSMLVFGLAFATRNKEPLRDDAGLNIVTVDDD